MKTAVDKTKNFFNEVWVEFAKCTRPSYEELKESTIVIVVTMSVLGGFIFGADFIISKLLSVILTKS